MTIVTEKRQEGIACLSGCQPSLSGTTGAARPLAFVAQPETVSAEPSPSSPRPYRGRPGLISSRDYPFSSMRHSTARGVPVPHSAPDDAARAA